MRNLFQNLWLKLIALAMGFLLWFHVATEKTYNYELRLPIARIDLREHHTLASLPPDSVIVSVTAKGKQLLQTDWQHQGVKVNATRLSPGEHTVTLSNDNVQLTQPTKNVAIDRVIFPGVIELDVDVESKAILPVEPNLTISAAEGYAVSDQIDVVPPRVTVYGPKSMLRLLRAVPTESFEVKGLRATTTVSLKLVSPEGYDVRLTPDSVLATISVVPVKTRVYDNVPIVVYNVPPGFRVETEPLGVRIELAGPPTDIALLNKNALTVSADYRLATSNGRVPLKIDCPANFAVRSQSTDSVRIEVKSSADTRN